MICKNCANEFSKAHFNQAMCSDVCRKEAVRRNRARYKKSVKGQVTELKWRKNPEKKAIDKKYQSSERGRAKAVQRQKRLLENVYYLERKRMRQRADYRELRKRLFSIHPNCQCCGSPERLTIDHIKPMSLGGLHEPENIQVLCISCNVSKGQRTINYGL